MYYKLSRLVLTPASAKPSTSAEVFISNPQIDQESILGKLFFVAEIESNKTQALKIINFFSSYLEHAYYQSEKISLREKMGTIKTTEIFENALTKTNAEFENFLKKEKIKISPKIINIACGVIYKNELVFSSTGSIKSILIYPEKQKSDELNDKKIYKITTLDDAEAQSKKLSLNKIFSNVTEGKIPPEGYVVFTNEILPEYITNKHLTKIITTLPPTSAIEQVKNQLHKINSYVTFLALVIKNSSTPHVQRAIPKMNVNVTAQNSLEQMNETENATEKYLSPVGVIKPGRFFSSLASIFHKTSFDSAAKLQTTIRDKMFFARKDRIRSLSKIKYYAKNLFSVITAVIIYFIKALSNPKKTFLKIKHNAQNSYQIIKASIIRSINWFLKLTPLNKTLLIVFLVFTTLFFYNIYHITYKKNQLALEQAYKEAVQLITQKQNQINSSLLYKNEERARELLDETQILISELENYEKADRNLIADFKKENDAQIEKISHVVNIKNPAEIAQLTNLNENANPQSLTVLNDNVFINSVLQSEIYSVNLVDRSAGIFTNDENINFSANLNENEIIFVGSRGGILVNDDGEVSEIDNNFAPSNEAITEISTYNDRVYVLSALENEIFRFARNYSSKSAWLKEDIGINNAVDIGIDGYIYILKNNGEITKFLSGYRNEFDLAPASPSLTSPTKIKLTGDSEAGFIHVLEPSKNRIVVFEKSGNFLIQYKMESLGDLRDFTVLEEAKKIILLNGSAVYEINAEHLEK